MAAARKAAADIGPKPRAQVHDLVGLRRSPAPGDRHRHSSSRSRARWRSCAFRWRSSPTSCRRRCRSPRPIRARRPPVVESTVAQPIEAQVVGVDKMIYMKSTSGNDGSYNLTVSFALGTDPDINTVNVNNRVQTRAGAAAARGAAAGPDGAEAVLGDPAVHRVLQRGRQAGSAVHHQLRHHQRARRAVAHAGRRPGARCSAS